MRLVATVAYLVVVCFRFASPFKDVADGIIVENPKYTNRKSSSNTTAPKKDLKTALNQALTQSRQVPPSRVIQFVRQHQTHITIVLAVYAFRRELRYVAWRCLSTPMRDPQTGAVVRRQLTIHPTSILKILLLVQVMRRWQAASKQNSNQSDSNENDDESNNSASDGSGMILPPLAAFLLMGSRANPAAAFFLSKLLSSASKNSAYIPPIRQHYTFELVNGRYQKDDLALQKAIDMTSSAPGALPTNRTKLADMLLFGRHHKQTNNNNSNNNNNNTPSSQPLHNETVIIVDWTKMDSSISQMEILRDQVTFLVHVHEQQQQVTRCPQTSSPTNETTNNNRHNNHLDEIILLLESPGGSAADYSLASQQILRLRKQGIKVTICVDKVAASGGYMIACTASPGRLLAGPFAVLGSIGVMGQTFNIHKTLEGWGVRPLVFRGGKDKSPVGLVGEVTDEGISKVQDMIDKTHRAFKRHVAECRPVVASDIEDIATGDVWLGYDALDLGLVDRVITSDEYIGERIRGGARVLRLVQLIQPRYPFQKPTTASQLVNYERTRSISGSDVVQSVLLSVVRECLAKVVDGLGSYLSEGGEAGMVSLSRSLGATTRSSQCD